MDFSCSADRVAPQLLNCIVRHNGVAIRITEVEAYLGTEDPASHAYRGKTNRNAAMFGEAGRWYVYLSYGIHMAGNIVCAPEGIGQACLLRAGEVVEGVDVAIQRRGTTAFANLARGPGNLGQALALGLDDNGTRVVLEPRSVEPEWVAGPRIGISRNTDAPLRMWIPNDPSVSRRRGYPGVGRR